MCSSDLCRGMGKINIGERAFESGSHEMESGLKKMMGGMEIRKGKEGGVLGDGKAPRGSN